MLKIELQGLAELRAELREFSDRRFNASVASALTGTAKSMRDSWRAEIDREVDRPLARTKSAAMFLSASAAKLQSEVKLKDDVAGTPPATYLNPQERGGSRLVKKFEQALQNAGAMPKGYFTVPGRGAKLDAHGNVSRAQIVAVITALGTAYSPGYERVIPKTAAGRLRAMAKRGVSYIAVLPGETLAKTMSPGIYEASVVPDTSKSTWWRGAFKAVFLYKRGTTYRKRLNLEKMAIEEAPKQISEELRKYIEASFARLREKQAAAGG